LAASLTGRCNESLREAIEKAERYSTQGISQHGFQPASKFVLTVLLPSGAEKFPVSEPGDRRVSSGNFAERGVAGRKRNFAPGAFGSFGQTKEQGKNGNG